MPSISTGLIMSLRDALDLTRAVETGTFEGDGAKRLASVFREVVTIELSEPFAATARRRLAAVPNVTVLTGHSANLLAGLVDRSKPTLYFFDGHWSGGTSAGAGDECPVMREIAAVQGGHADDVVIVDDARYFAAPPPPPHNPAQWPPLFEVLDALRARRDRYVTLLEDRVIAVPLRARAALDAYGQRVTQEINERLRPSLRSRVEKLVRSSST